MSERSNWTDLRDRRMAESGAAEEYEATRLAHEHGHDVHELNQRKESAAAAAESHSVTLALTAYDDQPAFVLHCEPEGSEFQMQPGDTLEITFRSATQPVIDVAPVQDGIVVWRPSDAFQITARDRSGHDVDGLW